MALTLAYDEKARGETREMREQIAETAIETMAVAIMEKLRTASKMLEVPRRE